MKVTRSAVFLDRDGTLVKGFGNRPPNVPDEIELLPGVARAVAQLKKAGLTTVLVSNQGGIGLGYMTSDTMRAMNVRLNEVISAETGDSSPAIDAFYWCPHKPDQGCECRKPRAGLFYAARTDLDIHLGKSYMIGDQESDMEAALGAGIPRRFIISSGSKAWIPSATLAFPTFSDAAHAIALMESMRNRA